MKDNKQLKTILILFVCALVLLAFITIPSLIKSRSEEDERYFPTYEYIDVKNIESNETSSENYVSLKTHLENDKNFAKEMLIEDYNYNSFDGSNLRMLIKNYIYAYQLTNVKYLSSLDEEAGRFCMKQKYVLESFKELYNIDISSKLDYFPGYFEYIIKSDGKYCFNYKNIYKEFNNQVIVGIEEMSTRTGIVKATMYVYEYRPDGTQNQKNTINSIKVYISKGDFNNANNLAKNNLNATVTHKQVQFKVKNDGNFFKYQILISKMLDI